MMVPSIPDRPAVQNSSNGNPPIGKPKNIYIYIVGIE